MGSGYSKMKKQARALQEEYAKVQEDLKNKREEGSAGGGLVTLVLNGERELVGIKIKPECVSDIEGLEDLIVAAHKDASAKLEEKSELNSFMNPF